MTRVQYFFLTLIGFIGLILCTWNSPVYAQDTFKCNQKHLFWINTGIGVSSWELTAGISFSYQRGKHLFSIRYTESEEVFIPVILYIATLGLYEVKKSWGSDLGVMYGRIAKAKYGFISVSGGIGFVCRVEEYKIFNEYKKEKFSTFGIPIEGQLFFTPFPLLGIGICPFANLNLKESFGGVLICIQIGKLR